MMPEAGAVCVGCRRWPAVVVRQELQPFIDPDGRLCGRAVPVALCEACEQKRPPVASAQ